MMPYASALKGGVKVSTEIRASHLFLRWTINSAIYGGEVK